MIVDRDHLPQELADLPDDLFVRVKDRPEMDQVSTVRADSFYRDAFRRLMKNRVSVLSICVVLLVIALALLVPQISGYGYTEQNVKLKNIPPRIPVLEKLGIANGTRKVIGVKPSALNNTSRYPEGSVLKVLRTYTVSGKEACDALVDMYVFAGVPEGQYYFFGTDYLGRDILTRLFKGTQISLLIAFISVLTNLIIGVVYGSVAGFYGGTVDIVMSHLAEVLDGLPYIVVTILFMLLLGSGMFSIILSLTITGWIGTARLTRAQYYRFKGREYVLAARSLGVPDRNLIFRHILPNAIGPLITRTMIAVPSAIFSESFLAYIGLGIKPPEPSIGVLLSSGQSVLLQYPYQTLFPAILISVLMVAFNMLANGLRDALDPSERGRLQ